MGGWNVLQRWIAFLMAALFFSFPPAAWAAPVPVRVCGEGKTEAAAQDNGRRDAMRRILVRYLQPQADPASPFQRILRDYVAYTGKLEVEKSRRSDGAVLLFGTVQVDVDKIEAAIRQSGAGRTSLADVACFLIRVRGAQGDQNTGRLQQAAAYVCEDTFQRMGFQTGVGDELRQSLSDCQALSYEDFCNAMLAKIRQDYPEVTVAVLGEIALSSAGEDEAGFARIGDVRIQAVALLHGGRAVEFRESYRVKRETAREADRMVAEKSAMNASETLASKVLEILQGKRHAATQAGKRRFLA